MARLSGGQKARINAKADAVLKAGQVMTEDMWQANQACQQLNYAGGGLGAVEVPHAEQLKMRAQQALYVLAQARRIRDDVELMAAIRAHLREQRDEMSVLLDEIG